ncbi:MAG: hydroxymyristoyl-ACP dehydratase, partial [Bacteroidales bacterium]
MEPVKDILNYIPQRHPMIMIDQIVDVTESGITTKFLIHPENIFYHNGYFREPGIVENIAQTAAARVGYVCERENRNIPLGFIGAV